MKTYSMFLFHWFNRTRSIYSCVCVCICFACETKTLNEWKSWHAQHCWVCERENWMISFGFDSIQQNIFPTIQSESPTKAFAGSCIFHKQFFFHRQNIWWLYLEPLKASHSQKYIFFFVLSLNAQLRLYIKNIWDFMSFLQRQQIILWPLLLNNNTNFWCLFAFLIIKKKHGFCIRAEAAKCQKTKRKKVMYFKRNFIRITWK